VGIAAFHQSLGWGPKISVPSRKGAKHVRKPRLTPPMLDFERVRLDRLAATEAKEAAMLTDCSEHGNRRGSEAAPPTDADRAD